MQPKNISCVFYLKFFFIVDSGSLIRYFLCESSQVSEWVSKWKNLVVNSTCKNKIKKEKKLRNLNENSRHVLFSFFCASLKFQFFQYFFFLLLLTHLPFISFFQLSIAKSLSLNIKKSPDLVMNFEFNWFPIL